jgi:hypothetical protein
MVCNILLEDYLLTHRAIPYPFPQLSRLLSRIAPRLSLPKLPTAVFMLIIGKSELTQDGRRPLSLLACDCFKSYLLLRTVADFPIDSGGVNAALSLHVGLIIGELAIDDLLAISLETVLHIQQFLLCSCQSITLNETGSVRTLFGGIFMGVPACQSELFFNGVFDSVTLVDLSDVIMEYKCIF